ncbi:ewing's tumor-associated antigen 1 isoform X2 [Mastomys coucha]|nr:ewing's tumor-associated antigen 1 isoform X2 [Mastomys coucha]
MLGVWIGETAIPCTPGVAKEKSRVKISCTKLKTKNREKELMKLAQQFDRNMEELDVIQEQDVKNQDFIQPTSEMGHLDNHKDSVQMASDDVVPEISCTPIKRQMKGDTRMSPAKGQDNSQKPFDQNVEAAFNALFDGSIQMCSGQLSQDLSDASLNNSKTSFRKKNALLQEEIIRTETLLTENLPNTTPVSPSPQEDTTVVLKSCVTPCPQTPAASNKQLDELTANDFEDDWESLLSSEPFLMENAEILELFPSTTAQDTGQKAISTSVGENDTITSRANMNLGGRLRNSKITLDLPSKTRNRELRNAGECRFSPQLGDGSRKLPFTGNKVKFEKSVTNIVSKDEDYVAVSNLKKVKEDSRSKCILNTHSSNKSGSYTRYPNEQNYELGVKPLQVPTTDPFDSGFLGKENIVCNTNQSHGSKFNSFFDDWNDPLLASEMIKACHQLETTWEADDVDDDLLYQACDDIERLTQQENKGSKELESVNSTSKRGSRNICTASIQGSQLVPSKHWNFVSSAAPLSLANKSQMNKPLTVEKRDTYGDCPNILDATNSSVYSMSSNNNNHTPVQVNSSKFVLGGSSNLNVNLGPVSTKIATNIKLSTQQLSHNSLADKAQNDNKILKLSKFTFKKKNPQFLSQLNQNHLAGNMPVSKVSEDLGKRKTVNSLLEANHQQSSIKYSESLKPSSPDEEERNRKYSPEEIQQKRQEALVRRKAKALHTLQSPPISLP